MEPDKQCARCQNEVHLEYFPDSATAHKIYDKGEVVRIKESVDRLVQRGIIERTAAILNYDGFAFRTVSRSSASDGDCRIRPALLIKPRKVTKPTDSSISSTIVLFATFEGYAPLRSDLPRVLQWFSIPVAPHSAIQTMTEEDHIHTHPEWSNSKRKEDGPVDAWLIAREYSSMGCVDRRWGNVNGTRRGSTFEVDWDTWEDILQSMEDLWTSWVEECHESRGVLEEYQKEYLECLATMEKRRARIKRREAEKVAKVVKQKAVPAPAPAGTSAMQQPTPVVIPSLQASPSQEMRQATQVTPTRSFASVLASGSKQKSAKPAQPASTTVQTVNKGSLPATKRASAVRPSTTDRLRALFAPKDQVAEPSESPDSTDTTRTPSLCVNAQRTNEQSVNESTSSSQAREEGTKGERIAVPA